MNEQFIDEVMGLVEDAASEKSQLDWCRDNADRGVDKAQKDYDDAVEAIRAKLREFVREPKNVVYPEGFGNSFARVAYDQGWKGAERAHNIGAK